MAAIDVLVEDRMQVWVGILVVVKVDTGIQQLQLLQLLMFLFCRLEARCVCGDEYRDVWLQCKQRVYQYTIHII